MMFIVKYVGREEKKTSWLYLSDQKINNNDIVSKIKSYDFYIND